MKNEIRKILKDINIDELKIGNILVPYEQSNLLLRHAQNLINGAILMNRELNHNRFKPDEQFYEYASIAIESCLGDLIKEKINDAGSKQELMDAFKSLIICGVENTALFLSAPQKYCEQISTNAVMAKELRKYI